MDKYGENFLKKHANSSFVENLEQEDIFDDLYSVISTMSNKNRLKILFIIAEENIKNESPDLFATKIKKILLDRYDVEITDAALGNFLKQLFVANLIKKEKKKGF